MKPIWIIENLTGEESYLRLSEAAKKAGFPVQDLRGDYYRSLIKDHNYKCVIFNGSIEMTKLVGCQLKEQKNSPVSYNNAEKYLCSKFYGRLGDYLFNDNYIIVPLQELGRRRQQFFQLLGEDDTIFIRPDSGDKTFKGQAIQQKDVGRFLEYNEECLNELAVLSTPKNIRGEWRFVVNGRDKSIIAQSSYRIEGKAIREPFAPAGAVATCQSVLNEGYIPDSVFCIDIAEDNDGEFWLLELTSFSSAGLYACDMDAIVEKVSAIAEKDFLHQG